MSYNSACIIGGGACGLATLRALIKEGGFDRLVGFEQRDSFGGIWNHNELADQVLEIPSIDPSTIVNPVTTKDGFVWPNAVYDDLQTNTPYPLMELNGHSFPEGTPLFPHRTVVLDYISKYGEDLKSYYRFETRVVDVQKGSKSWIVRSRKVCAETEGGVKESTEFPDTIEEFDAVLVAIGVYDLPFIPALSGLNEWNKLKPNTIVHSKTYRHPRNIAHIDGNILVIGNSASGIDICYQYARFTGKNIYKSARSPSKVPGGTSELVIDLPDIDFLDPESESVVFVDGSRLENVKLIIFATGYLRSLPFFKLINATNKPLITSGARIHGLYKHCWSYEYPGLAFIAISRYVLPFHAAEIQGSWLAKILRQKLSLPSYEQMQEEEKQLLRLRGDTPAFHDLTFPDDVEYTGALLRDIKSCIGYENGLVPKEWTERELSLRKNTKLLKKVCLDHFEKTGENLTIADVEKLSIL
ncbi:hypothetical protein OGAPHI_006323 [Ogataea philodendri]|uniref:Flavin-containing monooxygenase n=1 Tax=Ogataea philodendri TaxID=1378263 RepID=A0A9P8T1A7_9ASCO|nr:uncharacterized protein OGAPHI_006323 [Ogataea philodendri]KAH3661476.1 hypothetical protein OGAPHI_006323 [Ogataea philodendri]